MKKIIMTAWSLLFSLTFLMPPIAKATTVVLLDLVDTVKYPKARVFAGKCTSSKNSNLSNGWEVINYTFQIQEVIRDFNKPDSNAPAAAGDVIPVTVYNGLKGVPVFKCGTDGEEGVYAFMAPSQLGLSAPVALDRGVFRFSGGPGAQKVSVDSFSGIKKLNVKKAPGDGKNLEVNSKALGRLQSAPDVGGQVEVDRDTFLQVVRGIARDEIGKGQANNSQGGGQ